MCGRVTLTALDLEAVAEIVGAKLDPADAERYRPRYNIAPSDPHWIVTQDQRQRTLRPARWGFAGRLKPLIINVRSETAAARFKTAFQDRRCIVPVDGFYEWTGARRSKHPVWYHARNEGLLLLAGLFEPRSDGELAFVVLTTEPNKLAARVHDRMPVIIPYEKQPEWLGAPSSYLLKPAAENVLVATEVSNRANSISHDDPSCLEPWQESQLKLL